MIVNIQEAIGVIKSDFMKSADKDQWNMEVTTQLGYVIIKGSKKDDPEKTVEVRLSEKMAIEAANDF